MKNWYKICAAVRRQGLCYSLGGAVWLVEDIWVKTGLPVLKWYIAFHVTFAPWMNVRTVPAHAKHQWWEVLIHPPSFLLSWQPYQTAIASHTVLYLAERIASALLKHVWWILQPAFQGQWLKNLSSDMCKMLLNKPSSSTFQWTQLHLRPFTSRASIKISCAISRATTCPTSTQLWEDRPQTPEEFQ